MKCSKAVKLPPGSAAKLLSAKSIWPADQQKSLQEAIDFGKPKNGKLWLFRLSDTTKKTSRSRRSR